MGGAGAEGPASGRGRANGGHVQLCQDGGDECRREDHEALRWIRVGLMRVSHFPLPFFLFLPWFVNLLVFQLSVLPQEAGGRSRGIFFSLLECAFCTAHTNTFCATKKLLLAIQCHDENANESYVLQCVGFIFYYINNIYFNFFYFLKSNNYKFKI